GRIAGFLRRQRQDRAAVAVGDGLAQIEELLLERLALVAPLIAFELRERVGIDAQPRLALGLQSGASRAIEEAGGDVDLAGLAAFQRDLLLAHGGDRKTLGREVLDRERDIAGGLVQAV